MITTGLAYLDTASHALLTERIDPQGRVTRVGYETNLWNSEFVYRVRYVVDPDGRTNTFLYNTNSPKSPFQLTEIDDPFGRSAQFGYGGGNGQITSITDAAGNQSTFGYQSFQTNLYWLNSYTTPYYGTTSFTFDQQTDPGTTNLNAFKERATYVSEPAGAGQLFAYIHQPPSGVPTAETSPTNVPGHATFDNGNYGLDGPLPHRDSFHWDRRQVGSLSYGVGSLLTYSLSNAIANLTSNDFQIAHLSHWLLAPLTNTDITDDGLSVTEYLSCERDPSPDTAGKIPGVWTWYDYPNKPSPEMAGDPEMTCIARFLPDGTTQYKRMNYYTGAAPFPGLVSDSEASITLPNGTLGELTNSFGYSADGIDLTSVNNSVGQYLHLSYNSLHQVTNIVDAVGNTTGLAWDPYTYNLVEATLPSGATISLSYYPGLGGSFHTTNLATLLDTIIVQPENRTTEITDYSNNLPHIVHVSASNIQDLWLTNYWDGLNRLVGVSFQDNSTISNIFTMLSLTDHKDRLGNWSHFAYDGLEHLQTVTDARSNVTTLSWCGCGALTSVGDPLHNTNYLNYDNQGNLTNISYADGSSLNYQYDLNGRLTQAYDGLQRAINIGYNNQELVTSVSDTNGTIESVVYDIVNRPIQITDANNVTITNGYDLASRLTSRVWTYDDIGETFVYTNTGLIAYINRDGKTTQFSRDNAGRLLSVSNANSEITHFGYDALDHLLTLGDGASHTNTWAYNEFGWVTSKTDATNRQIFTYAYDANGQLTNRFMLGSGNTGYAYDAIGNLTNITYSNTATAAVGFGYDADNNLTSMVDAIGRTTWSYTSNNQVASETGPWTSNTVAYTYNQGHRATLTLLQPTGSAWQQTNSYDNAWRLTGLSSPAGAFAYNYIPSSASRLIQSLGVPNAAYITNQYDSLARLTNTSLLNYWGHVLDGYGYGYDSLGLRTSLSRYLGITANNITAGYDNIGQLNSWSAAETNGTRRLNENLGYSYDSADNLHIRNLNGMQQTFAVDTLNQIAHTFRSGTTITFSGSTPAPASNVVVNGNSAQLYGDFTFAISNLSVTSGSNTFTTVAANVYGVSSTNVMSVNLPGFISFQYDANGNLISDGTRSFVYDAENQLTYVYVTNLWQSQFAYDGLRRKRIEWDSTWSGSGWITNSETHFIYDGMLPIQERDANNAVLVTYTRGLDLSGSRQGAGGIGGLLARTDTNGSTYYHSDGSGNVTALIDATQNIVARYEYDPFGKLIGKWGPLADANHYRFSSKEVNPVSGLYSCGFRFYDPGFQRWVNRDPIEEAGSINLYRFVANSPPNFVDPHGLSIGDYLGVSDNSAATVAAMQAMVQNNKTHDYANMDDFALQNPTYNGWNPVMPVAAAAQQAGNYTGKYVDTMGMIVAPAGKAEEAAAQKIADATEEGLWSKLWGKCFGKKTPRNSSLAGTTHPVTGIPFKANGFPDFSSVAKKTVKIVYTGTREGDYEAANLAAGLAETPE